MFRIILRVAVSKFLLPLTLTFFLIQGFCSPSIAVLPVVKATPWPPVAIPLSAARASRVADQIRHIYSHAQIRVDGETNTIIVIANPDEVNSMRAIIAALDIRSPAKPVTEAIPSNVDSAKDLARKIGPLFPTAKLIVAHEKTLLVNATPADLIQIHVLINALDAPIAKPTLVPTFPEVAFPINQGEPHAIARAVAHVLPRSKVSVAGNTIIVSASSDDLAQIKGLLEQIDRPSEGTPYVAIYRLSFTDAISVANLLTRSFPQLAFEVTKDVNAISVQAIAAQQMRIANAISQLDVSASANAPGAFLGSNGEDFEVFNLRAAVPPMGGSGSSTASDIAQTVTQTLASSAPDLKIVVQPNSTKLVISGSRRSRDLARSLVSMLDVAEPLVELDTRVLEIDEGIQTQLGLKFPSPALATTYSEISPISPNGGPADFLRLQGLTRTPLTLGAQLDLLVANNEAKILEDPRITTFSGRTATLRAGETVNILTTAGGGTGTVATTQVQSFQTGVTLDITPVVNADNFITVTLHPSVNSIAGIGTSGVPNIQTRDTTTTIGLHDGETLIIGGLIEDTDTKTIQKVPLLGDIPLIGRLFQDVGTSHSRNELVVTVTPHVLKASDIGSVSRLQFAPAPLPTIDPKATLPPSRILPVAKASQANVAPFTSRIETTAAINTKPAMNSATPSAFSQTNNYTFGSAPQDNYADESQPPRIFYMRVGPTVAKNGTQVTISAITTTNVTDLSLTSSSSAQPVSLSQVAPGKWQSTFNFDTTQLTSTKGNVSEQLTASTSHGTKTTVNVPFTIDE